MLTEGDIQRILSRIVDGENPIAAGTFGSYATGLAHEGSDLDLFVIQKTPAPPSLRQRRVMRHLFGVLHHTDAHVFTPEEFEEGAYDELSFLWVIARQARLYHWTDEAARRLPSLLHARGSTASVDSPKNNCGFLGSSKVATFNRVPMRIPNLARKK